MGISSQHAPELRVELLQKSAELWVLQLELLLVGVVHVDELGIAGGVVGVVAWRHCAQAVPELVFYGLADGFVVLFALVD
jgi:hypothetical protein